MDRYLIYFWSHICMYGWMDEYIYKIKHQDDIEHWTYVHTQHFLHGEPLLLPLFPVIHHSSYKGIIMLVSHLSIIPLPSMSICFMMSEDSSPMLSMSSIPERFSNILKNQCDVRSITFIHYLGPITLANSNSHNFIGDIVHTQYPLSQWSRCHPCPSCRKPRQQKQKKHPHPLATFSNHWFYSMPCLQWFGLKVRVTWLVSYIKSSEVQTGPSKKVSKTVCKLINNLPLGSGQVTLEQCKWQ